MHTNKNLVNQKRNDAQARPFSAHGVMQLKTFPPSSKRLIIPSINMRQKLFVQEHKQFLTH